MTNAYDAVQQLRSLWLRPRGTTSLPLAGGGRPGGNVPVQAYLDDRKLDSVDELKYIDIGSIRYIRYYPPQQASAKWGWNHESGAIQASTRPLDKR